MNTSPDFSHDLVIEYLEAQDFTETTPGWGERHAWPAGASRWFDRGPARVELDDTDIVVYRFTDDRARLLVWQARFSQTSPLNLIDAAVQAAMNAAEKE